MSFTNPNFRNDNKKINNAVKEAIKHEENLVPLSEIMNKPERKTINVEYISSPTNGIITGVPRGISVSTTQLGSITIKYENNFYDNIKQSM